MSVKREKVLIVEDEMIIAQDLLEQLESLGYQVTGIACNFEEARDSLAADSVDIALLDVDLGEEKNGFDVAAHINEHHSIPFIFLTSFADAGSVARARSLNPFGYIVKPYKASDLMSSIEIALGNHAKFKREEGLVVDNALFFRDNHSYVRISLDEIRYLKAEGNYTAFHLGGRKHLLRGKLKEVLATLPAQFLRVQRSYAVNLQFVQVVNPTEIEVDGELIPLSKEYKPELLQKLRIG